MSTEDATLQYLTFSLGDEVFAMDIRTVREIIQHAAMTVVPLMPNFVRGVINLRGAVVPVIDLQSRFGRAAAVLGKKTCIVIFDASTEGEKMELGLMVDSVSEGSYDLLVIGAHRVASALDRILLEDITKDLMNVSPVPVLVVKGRE